ncbi:MAG: hypothetical protein J0H29_25225 [Sphingobacteriales bacterium]|nr:hypothetical protein [Sphingobacteriales bacterium]
MKETYNYTIELLTKLNIKYKIHSFASEIRMVDVWHNDKFYVLQFENDFIGFSEINGENIGFDTKPDEKFYDTEIFKQKLLSILGDK